jgi:hypothetical protein
MNNLKAEREKERERVKEEKESWEVVKGTVFEGKKL